MFAAKTWLLVLYLGFDPNVESHTSVVPIGEFQTENACAVAGGVVMKSAGGYWESFDCINTATGEDDLRKPWQAP